MGITSDKESVEEAAFVSMVVSVLGACKEFEGSRICRHGQRQSGCKECGKSVEGQAFVKTIAMQRV